MSHRYGSYLHSEDNTIVNSAWLELMVRGKKNIFLARQDASVAQPMDTDSVVDLPLHSLINETVTTSHL